MSGRRRGRAGGGEGSAGVAARVVALLALVCFLTPPFAARAEGEGAPTGNLPVANFGRLEGKWLRTDGGYLLELKDIKSDGALTALYFNPRPINVSRAEWRLMADRVQVFVELRDANYPGSTYLLVHAPASDHLEGYYHHALSGQTFDVSFTRVR